MSTGSESHDPSIGQSASAKTADARSTLTITNWPLPVKSLSASSLATFSRCAEQWRKSYLLKHRYIPSVSSVVGNATHGSAESNFRNKINTGVNLTMSDVEIAYAESFDNNVSRNGGPSEIDWTMKVGSQKVHMSPGQAKDRGLPLARTYHTEVGRDVQPIATEEWFELNLPEIPVPIKGRMDLITNDTKTDLKFGQVAKQEPETHWQIQGLTYLLVDETDNLSGLAGKSIEWHSGSWGGPRSDPKIYLPNAGQTMLAMTPSSGNLSRGRALLIGLARQLIDLYERYGPDEPWPTTALTHSWACRACAFYPRNGGSCYWWQGDREPETLL